MIRRGQIVATVNLNANVGTETHGRFVERDLSQGSGSAVVS